MINWIDWEPEKLLRIQVTYTDGGCGAPSIMGITGYYPVTVGPEAESPGTFVSGEYMPPTFFYEDWIIIPNPDWEQIVFCLPQGTIVEQLVIDTVSPEPASLSLLALAGLALLRRKR